MKCVSIIKRVVSLLVVATLLTPIIPPVIVSHAENFSDFGVDDKITINYGTGNPAINISSGLLINAKLEDSLKSDVKVKLSERFGIADAADTSKLKLYDNPSVSFITNNVTANVDGQNKNINAVVAFDVFATNATGVNSNGYMCVISNTKFDSLKDDRAIPSSDWYDLITVRDRYVFSLSVEEVLSMLDNEQFTISYKFRGGGYDIVNAKFSVRKDGNNPTAIVNGYTNDKFANSYRPSLNAIGFTSFKLEEVINKDGKVTRQGIEEYYATSINYSNGVGSAVEYKDIITNMSVECANLSNSIIPILWEIFGRSDNGKLSIVGLSPNPIEKERVAQFVIDEYAPRVATLNIVESNIEKDFKVASAINTQDLYKGLTDERKNTLELALNSYALSYGAYNFKDNHPIGMILPQFYKKQLKDESAALLSAIKEAAKEAIETSQNIAANNNNVKNHAKIQENLLEDGGSFAAFSYLINKFYSHTTDANIKSPDGSPSHYPGAIFKHPTKDNENIMPSLTNYSFFTWIDYKGQIPMFTANLDNYVDPIDDTKSFPSVRTDLGWPKRPSNAKANSSDMKYVTAEEDLRLRIMYNIYSQYFIVDDATTSDNYKLYKPWLDKIFSMDFRYTIKEGILLPVIDLATEGLLTKRTPNYIGFGSDNNFMTADEVNSLPDKIVYDASTANAAVDSMKGSAGSISPGKVATNLEAIMKYLAYGASGANAEYQGKGGTSTNTGAVKYSEVIDQVVPPFDYSDGSNTGRSEEDKINMPVIDWNDYILPSIPGLGGITNDKQGVTSYARMLLSLSYIKRYGAVPRKEVIDDEGNRILQYAEGTVGVFSKLEYVGTASDPTIDSLTGDDFKCIELDTFLLEEEGKTEKSTTLPDNINSIVSGYIGIYNGLKYIQYINDAGVKTKVADKWITPEIEAICLYYNKIRSYEDLATKEGSDFTEGTPTRAFKMFIGDEYDKFTTYYMQGVAASATYVPLITNTYEFESISVLANDTDFIQKFHYKYGFNRKALYMDTNVNAATRAYVAGQKDSLRVARLKDFLDADKDIVLYIDTNMYNVKDIAEKQNLSYNQMQNTPKAGEEDKGIANIADWWAERQELDAESICKTGKSTTYSVKLANESSVKQFGVDGKETLFDHLSKNHYLMSTSAIEEALNLDEYNPIQAFAVVSGIYRDRKAFTIAYNNSISAAPVFVSSRATPIMGNVSKEEFNSIYNYMLVKNLSRKLGMNYNVELDMDSPVFMDVYGNIVTESGLVVIPAVANATMFKGSVNYNTATAAMATLYGDADSIKISSKMNNIQEMMLSTGQFIEDDKGQVIMTTPDIAGTKISVDSLNTSSKVVRRKLYNAALTYVGDALGETNDAKFNQRFSMVLEVMRGAPIEAIDYSQEGLSGITDINKTGIYLASKVEGISEILSSNSDGNSLFQLPNIAFMPSTEYLVVIGTKVLIAIMLLVLVLKLWIDGNTGAIGIKTIGSMLGTTALIILSIVAIPTLLNYSYYQTNKSLIQDEASYIGMLNLEKSSIGQEIGVKEITTPKTTSKLFLKLDNIEVPWWNVAIDIFSDDKIATMTEMYAEAYDSSIFTSFKGVEQRGTGLYINVNDVYNSSEVRFRKLSTDDSTITETGELYQHIPSVAPEMSYVIPYYMMLDTVIADVNKYNEIHSTGAYTSKVMSGDPTAEIPRAGVNTVGMIKSYFLSNTFLEGTNDVLGMYAVYGIESGYTRPYSTVSSDNIDAQRLAMWCMKDKYTDDELKLKLEELDLKVKDWIVTNRGLLDQITDETFLKSLVMYASTQHNDIFKVPAARALEVMALDTRDVLRLALAPRNTVVKGAQCSLTRFVYNEGGVISVIMLVFLLLLFWITSLIKPLVTYVLFGLLLWKFVSKQIVRNQGQRAFQGYLISMGTLCFVNIVYAVLIKVALIFPAYGSSMFVCAIFQIVLQIVYVVILMWLLATVMSDADNIGMYGFSKFYDSTISGPINSTRMHVDRLTSGTMFGRNIAGLGNNRNYNRNTRTRGLTGNGIMNNLRDRDNRRSFNAQEYRRRR